MNTLPNPASVLDAFNDACNRHDTAGMMALMTEDCVFENTWPPPDGERFTGQTAVRAFWVDFFAGSPHARFEVERAFVTGDQAAQCWLYTWVDEHGTSGHVRGVDVLRFSGGKIAEKLSYVKG